MWREVKRFRIRAVWMNNLRGLLDIKRMDKVPNALIRKLCGATKGVDKGVDEGILRWLGHLERIEYNRNAINVCGEVYR